MVIVKAAVSNQTELYIIRILRDLSYTGILAL